MCSSSYSYFLLTRLPYIRFLSPLYSNSHCFNRLWKHSSQHRGRENLLHSLCHIWHPSLRLLVGGDWRPAGDHLCEKHLESWKDFQGELQAKQRRFISFVGFSFVCVLFSLSDHFTPLYFLVFVLTACPVLFVFHFQQKHQQISQTKIRVTSTILFILAGCIVFVTIPAVIFKHIEGWTTLEAIYFVVITLTTVGIGDYVAGSDVLCYTGVFCQTILTDLWPRGFCSPSRQVETAGSTTWSGTSPWCGSGSWWGWRTLQQSSVWLETGFECSLRRPKRRWASFNFAALWFISEAAK